MITATRDVCEHGARIQTKNLWTRREVYTIKTKPYELNIHFFPKIYIKKNCFKHYINRVELNVTYIFFVKHPIVWKNDS